jgi:branched-chain amino acid transport system substrate-binding protein
VFRGRNWAILTVLVITSAVVFASCAPAATPTPQVIEKVETKVVVVTPTPPPPAPLPDVIKIGCYEPMTGGMAAGGQQTWEGVELCNMRYKSEVLGKPIEVVLADNRSDKTEAAMAMSYLIEDEKVVGVVGTYGSSLSIAAGEVSEAAGIPVVGCSPTNPMVTEGRKYYFRVCFIDPFQGYVMAKYAVEELGAQTACVIQAVDEPYSVGLSNYFIETFGELTGDPKNVLSLTSGQTGDTDFTAQLTYSIGKNPDVIFAPFHYREAGLIVKQARELGYEGPLIGGDTWDAPEFIEIAGDACEGAAFSTHFHPEGALTGMSQEFINLYEETYGKEANAFAALGWDAYMLLVDAIERAGSVDGDAIQQQLEATTDLELVTGMTTINRTHDAVKPAVIKQVQRLPDGTLGFVYLMSISPR